MGTYAASDYFLKLDGVDGESKPARATVEPVSATTVAEPETGGTETTAGYMKMGDIKGESVEAEKKKGNVDYDWKVEEGEKAMEEARKKSEATFKVEKGEKRMEGGKEHKNEIDILSADGTGENATNFGILLGGTDTSEERKRGLERAAEVIIAHAAGSDRPIESISLNFEKIEMKTKNDARLFGFIPVTLLATIEIDESETATVTLPWWAVFATGVEREEIGLSAKATLSNILKTKHDTVKNAIQNIR